MAEMTIDQKIDRCRYLFSALLHSCQADGSIERETAIGAAECGAFLLSVVADICRIREAELSCALADTVLSPDETFAAQAKKLMSAIRDNKGKPALSSKMQLDS